MSDVETKLTLAKELLKQGKTLVLLSKDSVFTDEGRGIARLAAVAESGARYEVAADTIVGRAAALLYLLLGVKAVYAETCSKGALKILREKNIVVEYSCLAETIRNRTNTGLCPMEQAVEGIDDEHEALKAVLLKLRSLRS